MIATGREFQREGAATPKLRSPKLVRVLGTTSRKRFGSAERRFLAGA